MARRTLRLAAVFLALSLAPLAASARNTFHDLDVAKAKAEGHGHENLLDIPVFMAGQKHAAVVKDLGVFPTNMRTNAANKSDEAACQIAFLSALIRLQSKARELGADAVVDIRSITKHRDLESAKQYRCVAGAFVANVALQGRMVKLAK
ncbi:MAG TPA: excinuclease ABC subunit A [Myxococcota bacterium]|nr:excinuclease ABC subunit A [Myxococcota bacterium]